MLQPVTQMKGYVDTFASNADINQLNTACSNADTFLVNLNLIFGPVAPEDIGILGKAASDYRQALEKNLAVAIETQRNLLEKAANNETRMLAIESALNTEQQRLSVLLNEQQSQFSAAQDKRASDFAATQADYLAKYTSAATEQQTQFSTDQDERKTAFSSFQRESQEKLSMLMEKYDDKLKEHDEYFLKREKDTQERINTNLASIQNDYETKAAAILAEIDKHKRDQ